MIDRASELIGFVLDISTKPKVIFSFYSNEWPVRCTLFYDKKKKNLRNYDYPLANHNIRLISQETKGGTEWDFFFFIISLSKINSLLVRDFRFEGIDAVKKI